MELKNKRYTLLDSVTISFRTCPFIVSFKLIFMAISSALPVLRVYVTASVIDTAIGMAQGTADGSAITVPLLLLLATIAYEKLENAVTQITQVRHRLRLYETFRAAIVRHRSRLDYPHVENNDTYDLIKRVSDKPAERVVETFEGMIWLISMTMNVLSLLVMLFISIGWLALAVIAVAVPVQYIALKNGKRTYEGFKQSEKIVRRADYLGEILTQRDAVDERAMFGFSGAMSDRFLDFYKRVYAIMAGTFRQVFSRKFVSDTLMLLVSVAITGAMILPALSGTLSVALFVSLTGMVFSVVQYTSGRMPWLITDLSGKVEYFKDLSAFSALETVAGVDDLPQRPAPALERIVFRDVAFTYPGTDFDVLRGINLTLEPGKHYALVGANGAGKSTLVKLLTGLYSGYRGEILINGRELRTLPAQELKAFFALVYQDFARYSISLEDNIALGAGLDLEKQRPDISRAAGLLDIGSIADELPNGMDTIIGKAVPGGQDLSGGQWQRVAMARALASDAPVAILDEPTAALDPISESNVYHRFEEISRDRTTVFISHRLGSTKLADEIIVLDEGVVAEQGSHDRLMEQGGRYAAMYDAQRSWYR